MLTWQNHLEVDSWESENADSQAHPTPSHEAQCPSSRLWMEQIHEVMGQSPSALMGSYTWNQWLYSFWSWEDCVQSQLRPVIWEKSHFSSESVYSPENEQNLFPILLKLFIINKKEHVPYRQVLFLALLCLSSRSSQSSEKPISVTRRCRCNPVCSDGNRHMGSACWEYRGQGSQRRCCTCK